MAAETLAASAETLAASSENVLAPKKNRIQVSNTKKPLFFYVNLAKRYIQQHNEVELSALGMAITTVVTIAEILKNNGVATEKKVLTSSVGMKDESRGRVIQKAKIEIVLEKSDKGETPPVSTDTSTEPTTTNTKTETVTTNPTAETATTDTATEPAAATATATADEKK